MRRHKKDIRTWLCYYGNTLGPEAYTQFDLVVLDGRYHPPLAHGISGRPVLLGYVSIGEVEEEGHLWPYVKQEKFLVKKNEFWNSWVVDVRHPSWQRLLEEFIIPSIIDQGFDGLFLDTIDSSLGLLHGEEGSAFEGTGESIQRFVENTRIAYPGKYIAVNRGLPLIPRFARHIDSVVVENLYSLYAGPEKGYVKVGPYAQGLMIEQIKEAVKSNPDLLFLTLDYADPAQRDLVRQAITFSRKGGFVPYVSTHKLDTIFFATLDR